MITQRTAELLLDAVTEASSLFDNYPHLISAVVGTYQVVNTAMDQGLLERYDGNPLKIVITRDWHQGHGGRQDYWIPTLHSGLKTKNLNPWNDPRPTKQQAIDIANEWAGMLGVLVEIHE